MQKFVGIDIGGTKIDGVLIYEDGQILSEYRLPTQAEEGGEAVIARIVEVIQVLTKDQPISGIGIGCPGYVDSHSGVVRAAVNLGWQELPLQTLLQAGLKSDVPIVLGNDVNAAAVGEWQFGTRPSSLIYLAVGTGLGGAAIVHNQLVEGANSFAMEVGHWVMEPHGRHCKCGLQGCAETYLSGVGLAASLAEYLPSYPDSPLQNDPSTPAILTAARQGDALAQKIIQMAGSTLGRVMATCATLFNPEQIIVGGGLGLAAADLLLEPAQHILNQSVLAPTSERLEIKLASVPRIALGAACLAFPNHQ